MTTLSVVIPAYNERDSITEIAERVLATRPALTASGVQALEVIVVDDGSQDGTAEIVAGHPDIRLIRHPANCGYGAALKTGFRHACGELLAFLDADGTYPPEYLPHLCRPILRQEADLVIGSRMAGAESRMPLMRRLGNSLFAALVSLLGDQSVSDSASGMRVLKREILPLLYPLPDGLNFTPVMSTRALHEGIRMVEIPIPYDERVGDSKLKVVKDGTDFLQSIVWTALSYNPVRVLGAMGAAGVLAAGAVGLALAIMRAQGITTLGPWGVFSVYAALVMGVSGVSLFALGATFNYLVGLFHKRPIHQGLFGRPIFDPPLDRQFGWMGLLLALGGLALGTVSLILGLNGWPIARLWLYLVASAMLSLVGLQLMISWLLMRVLDELSKREFHVNCDLMGEDR